MPGSPRLAVSFLGILKYFVGNVSLMGKMNLLYVPLAAIIPLLTGGIWYSKPVFGRIWMRASGMSEENAHRKMLLVFGLTYLVSLFLAFGLLPVVIHQFGVFGVLANEPGINDPSSEMGRYLGDFMTKYGTNFRTFRHGAFHGSLTGLFIAMPVVATIALYEGKKFRYVAVHAGYWILTLALMGGVLCAFV